MAQLALWTIGHSDHRFDAFAGLLANEQIEFVADVRSYPYSRFAPHFNREELGTALRKRGIRYLFLGKELGGRPSIREHYDDEGHALYGPMSHEPRFRQAIDRLQGGANDHRIALLCSEGNPYECHRRLLVGRVLTERGLALRHILPDGSVWVEHTVDLDGNGDAVLFRDDGALWRSTRSVSHRRRLSTSSAV